MSLRRPAGLVRQLRLLNQSNAVEVAGPAASSPSSLIPLDEVPRGRLPRNTSSLQSSEDDAVLVGPGQQRYMQVHKKLKAPLVDGGNPLAATPQSSPERRAAVRERTDSPSRFTPSADLPGVFSAPSPPATDSPSRPPPNIEEDSSDLHRRRQTERNRHKKEQRWKNWINSTIPSLIRPYLKLMEQTNSFREELPEFPSPPCTCGVKPKKCNVTCVYFSSEYAFSTLLGPYPVLIKIQG